MSLRPLKTAIVSALIAVPFFGLAQAADASTLSPTTSLEGCGYAHSSTSLNNRVGGTLAISSVSVFYCWSHGDVTSVAKPLPTHAITTVGKFDSWKYSSETSEAHYEQTLFGQDGVVTEVQTFESCLSLGFVVGPVPVSGSCSGQTKNVTIKLNLHGDGTFTATGGYE